MEHKQHVLDKLCEMSGKTAAGCNINQRFSPGQGCKITEYRPDSSTAPEGYMYNQISCTLTAEQDKLQDEGEPLFCNYDHRNKVRID